LCVCVCDLFLFLQPSSIHAIGSPRGQVNILRGKSWIRSSLPPPGFSEKFNRSHTHTHTPTEKNTPDSDTHAHDNNNTPNPQNEHLPQTQSGIHLASATGKPLGFLWIHVQGFIKWDNKNLDSGCFRCADCPRRVKYDDQRHYYVSSSSQYYYEQALVCLSNRLQNGE